MSEYIFWESDKTEPIIEYREEFNVTDIARKYAERVARVIDEQTLANVENQLAEFGYAKVVRCRDCEHYELPQPKNGWNGYCMTNEHDTVPDGFCAWACRKGGGE